jgi:hypothetical protein
LKKRSKKLLDFGARLAGSVRKGKKVFWFFFCNCPGCRFGSSDLQRPQERIGVVVEDADDVPTLLLGG